MISLTFRLGPARRVVGSLLHSGMESGILRRGLLLQALLAAAFLFGVVATGAAAEASLAERQAVLLQSPPRKVVVATVCTWLGRQMNAEQRVAVFDRYLQQAADEAERLYPGEGLDLYVLPEIALQRGGVNRSIAERALRLTDREVRQVAALAARQKTWLVLPMYLAEEDGGREIYRNAAVLFDRNGATAGVYRKLFPLSDRAGVIESGVTPGRDTPVFTTDFGRLGIQICWDIANEDGWAALGANGAELVAFPSMSPQTIPLASYARRYRYWIVSANPRDNVTVFNPIGLPDAQETKPGVLVHRFDLVSAAIHWNPQVEDGKLFQRRFGDRVGYSWSTREDTGLFWSNDPKVSIGAMMKELGQEQMDAQVERIRKAIGRP